jgi:hypothetical protein
VLHASPLRLRRKLIDQRDRGLTRAVSNRPTDPKSGALGIDPVKDGGISSRLLTPGRYYLAVSTPSQRRRRVQALLLAAVAVGLVVVEPFPEGAVLVSLTPTHGVVVGDLPAVALLLVAACLAI